MVTKLDFSADSISIETLYADDGTLLDRAELRREEKPELRTRLAERERDYLLSTQLPNGAYSMYPAQEGDNPVNPYFADYTAMALLRAGETESVRQYLDWHFTHLNAAGFDVNSLPYTIYDYSVSLSGGQVTAESASMSYDSTDSYAASFLILLRDYYEQTGDADYIREKYASIAGVTQVLSVTVEDGLTLARPDYPVRYLMDNCEVYYALGAASELLDKALLPGFSGYEAVYGQTLADELELLRQDIAESLEKLLWDGGEQRYAYALDSSGNPVPFDPTVFYPESISQLSPMIYGLISPQDDRARQLYARFCSDWDWQTLEHMDSGATNHYWGMAVYCAAVMGDLQSVETYLSSYERRTVWHEPPLFNSDAAWVLLSCLY